MIGTSCLFRALEPPPRQSMKGAHPKPVAGSVTERPDPQNADSDSVNKKQLDNATGSYTQHKASSQVLLRGMPKHGTPTPLTAATRSLAKQGLSLIHI